jgi:chromosome segregation ATPase
MALGVSGVQQASLKGKLVNMEMLVRQITDEMNAYKREAQAIKSDKETLEQVLAAKIGDCEGNLRTELGRVEDEMNRNISHQKAENSRLQQQINQLKADKEELRNQIDALTQRIDELEMSVGDDEI